MCFLNRVLITVSLELIKTELKERKVSGEKIVNEEAKTIDETEILDLDLIEFGDRRVVEDESSESSENPDEFEGSGDEELEVKEMEILERTNHATNLEIPQSVTEPGGISEWCLLDGAI